MYISCVLSGNVNIRFVSVIDQKDKAFSRIPLNIQRLQIDEFSEVLFLLQIDVESVSSNGKGKNSHYQAFDWKCVTPQAQSFKKTFLKCIKRSLPRYSCSIYGSCP